MKLFTKIWNTDQQFKAQFVLIFLQYPRLVFMRIENQEKKLRDLIETKACWGENVRTKRSAAGSVSYKTTRP